MVDVALQVDQVRPLFQNAGRKTVLHGGRHLLHVSVAGAQKDVVADADELGEKADHVGGLAHGLAVGDLGAALVQVLDAQSQQIGGREKRKTRAGGLVAEDADRQTGIEAAGGDVRAAQPLQGIGHGHDFPELIHGFLPGQQKVLVKEIARKGVDFLQQRLKIAHGSSFKPQRSDGGPVCP